MDKGPSGIRVESVRPRPGIPERARWDQGPSTEAAMPQLADGKSIVMDVDGSGASAAALRWAGEQARAAGRQVVTVHAWERTGSGFAPFARTPARPTAASP